jgi:hypothetical protein
VLASADHENNIARMTFAYAICGAALKIGQPSLYRKMITKKPGVTLRD